MALKRKRHASPPTKGLAPGELLKRNKLAGNTVSAWGWVDTEVSEVADITAEHRLATCGLSKRSHYPFCANKYSLAKVEVTVPSQASAEDQEDDIIVISDDEGHPCNKKLCKSNPNCLNYLGQSAWENEGWSIETIILLNLLSLTEPCRESPSLISGGIRARGKSPS